MQTTQSDSLLETPTRPDRTGLAILFGIAAAQAALHIATNSRYGFHRDELQFLADARHLDWGFVPYPPFTPAIEHLGLALFGISLVGLRLFSVLGQALTILLTGLMAREFGGGRGAQIAAALSVTLSGLPLFNGTEFQYTSFDFLWWVFIAYFVVRLLKSEDPRWWLAIGAAVGLGLETKYSIVFYIAGILAGIALTGARRYPSHPGGSGLALQSRSSSSCQTSSGSCTTTSSRIDSCSTSMRAMWARAAPQDFSKSSSFFA